jgi:hypothetical protein
MLTRKVASQTDKVNLPCDGMRSAFEARVSDDIKIFRF